MNSPQLGLNLEERASEVGLLDLALDRLIERGRLDIQRGWIALELRFKANQLSGESIQRFLTKLDRFIETLRPFSAKDSEVLMWMGRAHDLRNLIAPIASILSLPNQSDERIISLVNASADRFKRGNALLDEDVDRSFRDTYARWSALALSVGIKDLQLDEVPSSFTDRFPKVKGVALNRILFNVFLNAVRHGSQELDGASIPPSIHISFEPMGENRLKVFIKDTGPGFRGGDPFQLRGDQSGHGHGVGMQACRAMLKSVGGNIYPLDLHAEDGATWVMELPFKE